MKYTSAEANKLLARLNMEHNMLSDAEREGCSFMAATCENIEDARPEYDYASVQKELNELEEKMRKVKHAINVFNVTHEVPGFGMTIDQVLVYLPQLNSRKCKLGSMSRKTAKRRIGSCGNDLIEYEYANFDVDAAKKEFNETSVLLAKLQNALDIENSTVKFEIDI